MEPFLTDTSSQTQSSANLTSANFVTKRQSCQVCNSDANAKRCKSIKNVFNRERLTGGYHYMMAIPAGACNVTITQLEVTNNVLALRWTFSESSYFFNGDWITQGSGNYTADDNAFTYTRSRKPTKDSTNGEKEELRFSTQLTHSIDVCLISQNRRNHGVSITYTLPPIFVAETKPTNSSADKKGQANNREDNDDNDEDKNGDDAENEDDDDGQNEIGKDLSAADQRMLRKIQVSFYFRTRNST